MSLRNYGTNRPIDTGGLLRRGVVLLASLLLVCTLMAGAVSAEEWHTVSSYGDLKSNLEDGNWTKLGEDITSSDTDKRINLTSVNPRLDLNGNTLTMKMNTSAFAVGNDTGVAPGPASLTVIDSSSEQTGKINSTKDYLFFVRNTSTLTLESGTFEAKYPAIGGNANGEWNNPTFTVKDGVNLVSHESVAVFLPTTGTKATITGAVITGKYGGVSIAAGDITIKDTKITVTDTQSLGEWKSGPCEDGSAISIHKLSNAYSGDLTLRLQGTTELKSEKGAAFHNYISASQSALGKVTVTIDDSVKFNDKDVTSATYGSDCKGDGGIFQDTSGNILLYPGLNQTGVTWTGDADSGYTLAISADGSYKLMADVTLTATTDIKNKVTLDLNGHTITNPTATSQAYLLDIKDSGELTIQDSSSSKTGKIISSGRVVKVGQGKLSVLSGTLDGCTGSDGGAAIAIYGSATDQANYASVLIAKDATIIGHGYAILVGASTPTAASPSYGVNVEVYGTLKGNTTKSGSGLYINGNCQYSTSTNVPKFTVHKGAVVTGVSSAAIYGAGYAHWIIEDDTTFMGTEALLIKSGTWTIHGGTFTATGEYIELPPDADGNGGESTSTAISINVHDGYQDNIEVTIHGGTFTSQNSHALWGARVLGQSTAMIKAVTILGGTFNGGDSKDAINITKDHITTLSITGGKYSTAPAAYLPAGYTSTEDNGYYVIAKEVPKATATVTTDPATGKVTVNAGSSSSIEKPTQAENADSVDLNLKTGDTKTGDVITLIPVTGETLTVSEEGVVTGKIAAAVIKPADIKHPEGQTTKLELSTTNLEELFKGTYELKITNEPKASDMGSTTPENIVAGISVTLNGIELSSAKIQFTGIQAGSKTPQVWHAKNGDHSRVASTYSGGTVTATASGFSSYYVTLTAAAVSSSSGNTNNAFRVLFETQGGSYVSPATGLSYGDRVAEPANPVKDGYTFGGWYKDAACTQAWSFSDSIPGDMTLYAKWTSSGTAATATQTAQTTTKATTAPAATQAQSGTSATTAAPVSTTAAGAQPTLTQAPAPVLGALFGLLAAGILLRRRE
ncbi:MAG: InlB B-repeat-containing protein [Methanocorpusculum sp.]|nr:InlB B-repeat-containing protein [Methanocorpusculum sp.]MDE2525071.1 InlB B-repeat-containing protein [Methanocorpusculum sp.]